MKVFDLKAFRKDKNITQIGVGFKFLGCTQW